VLTPENIVLFFVAIGVSLAVAIGYDKLRPNPIITREDYLEENMKRLSARVEALQETIDLLSGRIVVLQQENARLKNELSRLVPFGTWRVTETAELRRGLEQISADEFNQLAFEQFRQVYDTFGDSQSLQAKRIALIEHAQKQNRLEVLRAAILAINSAAFG
jgi:regulator of replication initiation timing